jgi:predicted Zn-dependent protease
MRDDQKEFLAILGYFYLQHGEPGRAMVLLRALDAVSPDDPEVLKSLSYAHLATGQHGRALDATERYMAAGGASGDAAPIQLLRARALWHLGRGAEARDVLLRFVEARAAATRAPTPRAIESRRRD